MKARMSEVLGPPKAFLPGRRRRQSQPVLLGSGPPCALRGGAAPGQCTGAAQTPHGQRVEGLGLRLPLLHSHRLPERCPWTSVSWLPMTRVVNLAN